jgi:hypothetical protein
MPVARYFLFVGGALLALLFGFNAYMPQEAQEVVSASNAAPSIDKSVVRIRSDKKWPERVVYDTSLPTIVPLVANVQIAAAPPVPAPTDATARVRDTFAQFVPAAEPRKIEPQVQRKRRIAKIQRSHPAQPVRFAQQQPQQPHFGLFGGPTWNNTW